MLSGVQNRREDDQAMLLTGGPGISAKVLHRYGNWHLTAKCGPVSRGRLYRLSESLILRNWMVEVGAFRLQSRLVRWTTAVARDAHRGPADNYRCTPFAEG